MTQSRVSLDNNSVLTRRIIPCFDVDNGRVVKGVSFVELRDAGDPVELARAVRTRGRRRARLPRHHCLLRRPLARCTTWSNAPPTRCSSRSRSAAASVSVLDMKVMLELGAEKVSINTSAIQTAGAHQRGRRTASAARPSSSRSMRAACRAAKGKWEVFTHGGRNPAGLDAVEWAVEATNRGAGELLVTSMDTDGHLKGYDNAATRGDLRARRLCRSSPRAAPAARSTWSTALTEGKRRRRARGQHLPLRHLFDPRSERAPGGGGAAGAGRCPQFSLPEPKPRTARSRAPAGV